MRAAQGLPGIEGATHTSPERTELQLDEWRHHVAAERGELVLDFFFFSLFFAVCCTDPDVKLHNLQVG